MQATPDTSLRAAPSAPRDPPRARRMVPDRAFGGLAAAILLVAMWFSATPGGFSFWGGDAVESALEGGGSIIRKLQWFPLLMAALFLIWIRLPLARLLTWFVNPAIWGLGILATLSTFWSLEPDLTAKRIVLLWTTILIPFAFSITAWKPRRMDDLVRWVFLLMMFMSVFVEIVGPHLGMEKSEYWHGITLNKNVLGPLAVTAALFWVHGWMEGRANFFVAGIATVLSVACIVGAKSGTALVLFVLITPAVMFFSRPMVELQGAVIGLILGPVVLVVGVLAVYMTFRGIPTLQDILTPATGVIGKDPTLSSRDVIWSFSMDHILQRPWLGYGFSAFWEKTNPDVYHLSTVVMLMIVTEAHNGFLNVTLELGVGGLILVLVFIALEIRQVAQVSRIDRSMAALHGGLLAVFVFNNVTEATLMQATFVPFLTWLLSSMTMSRRRLHEKLRLLAARSS